ncbi:MAG: hypothetical protein KBS62_03085 [Oscillospiraceae bacterium]|nr:hypothetical protein [Candidatus Ruminococcus equi]
MAKFDTSKIENFDELSADELRELFRNTEIPDNNDDEEKTKLKNALNKATSEASGYKKQLREQMSEAERQKAEKEESDKEKDELIAKYQRNETVSNYTTKLVSLGLDEASAKKSAEALPNGIGDDFFTGISNYKTQFEKNIRADLTKKTPRPNGGSEKGNHTAKDFQNMSYLERIALKKENPEEYEALKNG